jgi:uncharacterized protein YcfL
VFLEETCFFEGSYLMMNKKFVLFPIVITFFFSLLYFFHFFEGKITMMPSDLELNGGIYELELNKWSIDNNGAHPDETTDGINEALIWASNKGYSTVKVPPGEYLIKNGPADDSSSRINMVSNMTLLLDENTVFQKEKNGYESYVVMYIGPGVQNVKLIGGTYKGDRYAHNYSNKDHPYSAGTHEGGYGIFAEGVKGLQIENVKCVNFTGDGILIGGKSKQISVLEEIDFEKGSINDKGVLVNDHSKIRTISNPKTSLTDDIFRTSTTIQLSRPKSMPKVQFDIYFYNKKGVFISSEKGLEFDWSLIEIPKGADYFHAVFNTSDLAKVKLEYWNKQISRDVIIRNSEFAFNRRQGVTVGGAIDVQIIKNKIHDMKGTAPQAGIDIEAGFFPNMNIEIIDNTFYNNESYNIIVYDGENIIIEDNYIGPNSNQSSIGLAISKSFRKNAQINNNLFDGSKIVAHHHALFQNNIMIDSIATFYGPDTAIEGMKFKDSQLTISSVIPFGVKGSDIVMDNNKKNLYSLVLNEEPVRLNNILIKGEAAQRNLIGNIKDGSIYNNFKIIGFNGVYGISLPRGTYRNCEFVSGIDGEGTIQVSRSGKYIFNKCTMDTKGKTINVSGYDKEIDVSIRNSEFFIRDNSQAMLFESPKFLLMENNKIEANNYQFANKGLLHFSKQVTGKNMLNDSEVIIRNNTIKAMNDVIGISTVNSGIAPPYIIEGNTLYQAKLELREIDTNIQNKEE